MCHDDTDDAFRSGSCSSEYEPPEALWGSQAVKQPRGRSPPTPHSLQPSKKPRAGPRGHYQYIRMELCSFGDLEEYIHVEPSKQLPLPTIRAMAFQMIFALYV